jgi:hypothetical protein
MELMAAPGLPADTLSAPGMVLVIRSESAAEVSIVVKPAPGSHSASAELKLERLLSADIPFKEIPSRLGIKKAPPVSNVQILAHVAGRGDVLVPSGEWVAGPEFPSQIEGLTLQWPGKPVGVDLEYGVTIGTRSGQRLPVRRTGEFAGTRGRGLPITSFALTLRGGEGLSLQVEGLFLGAAPVVKTGHEVSLTGPTGREPLVGLRVSLLGLQIQTASKSRNPTKTLPPSNDKDRVRVFRGPRARAA